MYTKLKKYIAACCAFLLVSFFMSEAKAATASEGETESTASEESLNPGTIELDVPAYLVRYLYREPDADEVQTKRWYDGWGMMLYWNPDFIPYSNAYADKIANKVSMSAKGLGFAISKDFNKYGGIRIGANYSSVTRLTDVKDPKSTSELSRLNVSIDYLWNLSNTYYGYDLHRTDEWLLTAGFKGGRLLRHDGDLFGSVNLGLQYRKNIANDMSFFIEPQFAFFSDQYDDYSNNYEIDPGLNLLVGLYFRLGKPKMQILDDQNQILKNLFFQAYGGNAFAKETNPVKGLKTNDYTKNHMNFGFNVGSWLNPSLAIRLGYFENILGQGRSDWRVGKGYGPTARQTYRGGRIEFVLNPITILTNKPSLGRFGWDVSVGYEAGVLNKHKANYNNKWTESGANGNHVNLFAGGVTFGTELKYYMSKNYALFLDGRLSNPMYTSDASDGLQKSGDYTEKLMSWAIGMEYYISTFDRYTRFAKGDHHESRVIDRLPNKNRWYTEIAAGLGENTHWGENFKARQGFTGAVALGVNYNDYNGLRMRGALTRKFLHNRNTPGVTSLIPGDTYQISFGIDYMLNLTNLWWGKDETNTRWSDINIFAGPTIQIAAHDLRNSLAGRNVFGAEVGAQFTRRITKGLDFFIEPRYEYNVHMKKGELFNAGNRWNLLAGVKMYQFREKHFNYRDSLARHDKESYFLEIAGGAGFDVTGQMSTMKNRIKNPDMDVRLGIGYRINPISSVRANALWTNFAMYKGSPKNGEKGFEFSFDYMANLLNLWYGNNPHRAFQLQGFAGPLVNPENLLSSECTKDIVYDWRVGVEFGAQLIYAPFQNVSLFLEPRASYYISDYITKSGQERTRDRRDEHFDVFAGLIFYNQPERLMNRGYNTTDPDSTRMWYYEMAGGASLTPSGHKGDVIKSVAPSLYLGIGHYMNNRSSLRFRLALTEMLNPENDGYKDKFITGLSLDYIYNLTNSVMGVNPYRRFDFSLYGGPVAEYYNSKNPKYDMWDKGVNFGGQLSWHANNYIDFFAEAREVMSFQHHTRYEALAGVKLLQNKSKTEQYRDSAAAHANSWFAEVAAGAGTQFTDDQKQLDGTGKIGVGYRFNTISSFRLTGAGWARQDRDNHRHFGRGEFSFDYMANLLNLWYGVDPYRRFNLRGYFGPTVDFDYFTNTDRNMEVGLAYNAGLQLSYSITNNVDLLLEPRYVASGYSFTKKEASDIKNRGDIYAGLIFYNRPGLLPEREYNPINLDSERGWFLELAGGISFAPDGRLKTIEKNFDPMGSVAIGRYLNNYSAVRARGSIAYVSGYGDYKKKDGNRKWVPEASLDYVHNMTNQIMGVNPYRRFDFSLFAGPMAQVAGVLSGNFSPSWGVNGGAQLAWHMNNFVDIFAEPRVSYLFQEDNYSRFQALAGVRLHRNNVNNLQYLGNDAKHANTWFLETAAGAGTLATAQNHPDYTMKLAAGYRYNPISSIRLSAMAWTRKVGRGRARSAEVALDYMANIQNILYGVNPYRRFNLRGFVGGIVAPDNFLALTDMKMLVGVNAGLQGSYAITDNIDFMVEPRAATFLNGSKTPRLDVYAGLIFYNQRGMMMDRGYNPTNIDDKNTWFVEMAGGLSFSPDGRTSKGILSHIDRDLQIGLGVHLNNYSSLRGRGNLTFVQKPRKTKDRRSYIPEVALDYMYNLTNGIMGVNQYRRFDLNLFAGPTARLTGLRNMKNLKLSWGVDGGAQGSWHINSNWDLFGEGRLLVGKNFSSRLSALGGIAYRFDKIALNASTFDFQSDRLYTQVLAGLQVMDIESLNPITVKSYSAAPSINYNIGYRFNKLLGMQAGFFSDHLSVDSKKGKKNTENDVYSYGLRGEVVASLMNMFNSNYDSYLRKFNWTASVGVQTGRNRTETNATKYSGLGFTAATQAQYRVFSHSWAVLELRAQSMKLKTGLAMPMSAQLGMMYDFQKTEENNNTASKIYVQGGAGMFESKTGNFEVGAGYDITPIHGLRLTFNSSFDDVDEAGSWKAISPDYVCNLTNLFLGHDDDKRHVDFSVLVGADFLMNDKKDGVASNSVGVNAGAQLTFNINKNWQLYTEPCFSFGGKSDTEIQHNGLNMNTTVGLKYRLPQFKKN